MNHKHISQYFDPLHYLFDHPSTSIEEMRNVLKRSHCPTDQIDSVISGKIKDEVINIVVSHNGITHQDLSYLLKGKITDITDNYIDKLIEHMQSKKWINIEKGLIFKSMVPIRNLPLNLSL